MIENKIELFDIIENWVEATHPHLMVRTTMGGEQIRIYTILLGQQDPPPNQNSYYIGDIMVIYPQHIYIVLPNKVRSEPRSLYWKQVKTSIYDLNYFEILDKELNEGIKNL